MRRRGFLGALAAFALDPERALWVPGAKTISIPKHALPLDVQVEWVVELTWTVEELRMLSQLDQIGALGEMGKKLLRDFQPPPAVELRGTKRAGRSPATA